jgi:outer membrane protein assembly factor BamB
VQSTNRFSHSSHLKQPSSHFPPRHQTPAVRLAHSSSHEEREYARLKISAICLALASTVLPLTAQTSDSSSFRGNPAHTGVYEATGVPKFSKLKWKFETKGRVYSTPAVVGEAIYFGSTDHKLYAVHRDSGTLIWKFEAGSGITSSPAVADGAVYFTSYDSNTYALDAATGKLKWKFQTDGERRYAGKHLHGSQPIGEAMPDPFDYFLSSPVVWQGNVYFGSGDGNIYALNKDTGTLVWKVKTGDVVHASPAISNGILFVGSWDSYFYAIDAAHGEIKWRFKTGEDPTTHNQVGIQSSAVVADNTVYFGCRDSHLYAVDATTGKQKWAFDTKGSWVIGSPAYREGKVYFATSDTALLHVVDAATGAPVFSLKFKWPMFSSPAIAGNTLYIGSHEGKLAAVDLTTQSPAWTFQTDGSLKNGPTYTKPDGTPNYELVFADDFYDEMIIGVHKLLSVGAILSSPVIADDIVYVGSSDGNLYALM